MAECSTTLYALGASANPTLMVRARPGRLRALRVSRSKAAPHDGAGAQQPNAMVSGPGVHGYDISSVGLVG